MFVFPFRIVRFLYFLHRVICFFRLTNLNIFWIVRVFVDIGFPWNQQRSAAEKPESIIEESIQKQRYDMLFKLYFVRFVQHYNTESDHSHDVVTINWRHIQHIKIVPISTLRHNTCSWFQAFFIDALFYHRIMAIYNKTPLCYLLMVIW